MPLLLLIPLAAAVTGGAVYFSAEKVTDLAKIAAVGAVIYIAIKKFA